MRRLFIVFTVFCVISAYAQKKEISQARSYIKSRSDIDKAETLMTELLKDSANRSNIKIWITLADAIRTKYNVANEKLYLKEKLDTVTLFKTARKMFLVFESLDSLDAQPDKKGHINIKYRKKNSIYLDKYRRNLYNGGLFFIRNRTFDSAYDMMDTYLDCRNQPLFSDFDYNNTDNAAFCSSAAFWTVFSGYMQNEPDRALKYHEIALRDNKYRQRTLQYLAEIYLLKKDTVDYVKTLKQGFNEKRNSEFFFTRLMDYYNDSNSLDSALNVVNAALDADKDKELFLFAKSNVLLNMGRYSDCILISDKLVERNTTLPDVYYNAGVSYINMALLLEKKAGMKKENEKMIIEYYRKSMPYMEKYREMRPDDKDKWAPSLYNIYLKLNVGNKFEEISNVLWDMRQ